MKFLKRINPKYIFFSIFILCLAFLDVIRDYTDMSVTWRWWWHFIKIFGNCNVALIFLWDDIDWWLMVKREEDNWQTDFFWKSIFYPALWLMIIAFALQVITYNWLFGMVR